jgi:rubrerythrin
MKKMTEKNLQDAFAGESQAHMRYMAFGDKAEKENLPNIARVFRANAYAEVKHATNHLRNLGGIGDTVENVKAAIEGENFEVEEMYPVYIQTAQQQGEKGAETSAGLPWRVRPPTSAPSAGPPKTSSRNSRKAREASLPE